MAGRFDPVDAEPLHQHASGWVRALSALAGTHRASANVETLIRTLDDPDEDVATVAAYSLGLKGEYERLGAQLSIARWPATIATVLRSAAWEPTRGERAARFHIALGEWRECAALGEAAVGPLGDALDDRRHWIRAAAVTALGNLRTSEAFDLLAVALQDSEPRVRGRAATALASCPHRQVPVVLGEVAEDPDAGVRRRAMLALSVRSGVGGTSSASQLLGQVAASDEQPVFVVGAQRSGTTLVRLLLTSHSRVAIPPEGDFLLAFRDEFPGALGPEDWAHFVDRFAVHPKCNEWGLSLDKLREQIEQERPRTFSEIAAVSYRLYSGGAVIWGDKNPYYIEHLAELAELFPRARFVVVQRDGRDAAASVLPLHFGPSTGAQAARAWSRAVRAANEEVAHGPDQVHVVRYEDLVGEPAVALLQLCDFLGLEYEPAMLRFHEFNREQGLVPGHRLKWHSRTTQPIQDRAVGRWRRDLRPEQVLAFECLAGSDLSTLGYVLCFNID